MTSGNLKLNSEYQGYIWSKGPDRSCRCVSNYPSGNIESEGDMVFWSDDGPDIDSIEYGEWIYHYEDGTMKEKKDLSKN